MISVDSEELLSLNNDILECRKCPISESITQKVLGDSTNKFNGIMSIAEAPGADEDRLGKPFIGKAGKQWEDLLYLIKLLREDVYATNALHCRPSNNVICKDWHEINNCRPFLVREIEIIKPTLIIAWGKTAVNSLFNFKYDKLPMNKLIKENPVMYEVEKLRVPVFINYHPSFLMRNNKDFDPWLAINILFKAKAHYEVATGKTN